MNNTVIKNHRGMIIIAVILVGVLCVGYFAYQRFLNAPGMGLFLTKTTPLSVIPKLGSDTIAMTVNTKGGVYKLVDETAIEFPAKSILDSRAVTATKLESIENLPTGYQLVNGIELTPATRLGAAAKIRLPLPVGVDTAKLVGFEYAEGGKDFFLTPVKIVGQTAELTINGFSGHGVISIGDSSQLPPNPSTVEKQTKQLMSTIGQGKEALTSDDLSKIKNLLTIWFENSVRLKLEKAIGTDDASVDDAVHEFVDWLSLTQFYGLDDEFMSQKNSSYHLAAKVLKSSSDKAYASCVNNQDPTAAARLLRWYELTELMGLDGKSGLSAQKILDHARQCVNFELKITSEFSNLEGQKSTASGSVKLSINEDLIISGEGKIKQTSFNFNHNSQPCTASAPIVFPIKVPGVIFNTDANALGVSIYFELGDAENGKPFYRCPFGEGQHLTIHGYNYTWAYAFYETHESESIDDGYLIRDFEVSGDGTYAKKTYTSSAGDQNEHTTFELFHQPK